jgi:hypothetical protein
MNTNSLVADSFSNPATERMFENWASDRVEQIVAALKDCGACTQCHFIFHSPAEFQWVLCLNEESPHHLETVNWAFTCPFQVRDESVSNVSLGGPSDAFGEQREQDDEAHSDDEGEPDQA